MLATRIGQFNPQIGPFDSDRKLRVLQLRIQTVPSGRHIKLPTVPGTGHNVSAQLSFGERPRGMRTNTVQSVEAFPTIEDSHNPTGDNKLSPFSNGNL
jgi:hypothetical protein